MALPQMLEGTWEEIRAREAELTGRRVKVFVLPDTGTPLPGRAATGPWVERLLREWSQDTRFYSLTDDMADHPALASIAALGQDAVGPLLRLLPETPHQAMTALEAITREDPVRVEHYGDVEAMTGDWMKWAREAGY